jgi:hypothetical protein
MFVLSKRHKRETAYYNVTFRRIRLTIVVIEKQQVLHILSVCF